MTISGAASKSRTSYMEKRNQAASVLRDFILWIADRPAPKYVFRGVKKDYPLVPKIGRDDKHYSPKNERLLLENFKRHALPYLNSRLVLSDWDWLAIAQHHGLPTRLLDWTTNSLVAAFFANEISTSDDDNGVVHAIVRKDYTMLSPMIADSDPLKINEVILLHPPALAPRIIAQRGLFSVHPKPRAAFKPTGKVSNFTFKRELKLETLRLLHRMGIDQHSVMGDLDGLSATLKWRYETGMTIE